MIRCTHCDSEIRYTDTCLSDMAGGLFHLVCANELQQERNNAIDAARLEDWELEERRHAERFYCEQDDACSLKEWQGE